MHFQFLTILVIILPNSSKQSNFQQRKQNMFCILNNTVKDLKCLREIAIAFTTSFYAGDQVQYSE